MDWIDDGIVLSSRKHGENSAIVTLMTREHGCHTGLVRGGTGKRTRGILQPGNRVTAHWRGRLSEHLGAYTCELSGSNSVRGGAIASGFLGDPQRLAGLSSACAVTEAAMPERESHPPIFNGLEIFLEHLDVPEWETLYIKWELGLLGELGFGLDLSCCASTGSNQYLTHVSPKTGRAVSRSAAEPYLDKLLPLPPFLLTPGSLGAPEEISDGLALTGYFLGRHVFSHRNHKIPDARTRLIERLKSKMTNKISE